MLCQGVSIYYNILCRKCQRFSAKFFLKIFFYSRYKKKIYTCFLYGNKLRVCSEKVILSFRRQVKRLEKFTQSLKQKRPKKPEFFRENKKIALNA